MRIERLDVAVYRVPTEQPEADGTLMWDHTTVPLVEITAGGCTGFGLTYGPRACADVMRDIVEPEVIGRDAMDVTDTWTAMVRAIRNAGRPGIASLAIAAVDIGLWDLKARLLSLPLTSLLGQIRDAVPVYGSGGFTSFTSSELCAQLAGWVQRDGIPRVKMKIATDRGACPGRDLERARLARQAIGPGAELYVDANGGYTRKQAIRLAHRLRDVDVTWFEEPVSSDDLDGLREVREATDCDVAAGEYGYDLAYFARMCEAGAVDVLQVDVSRCGGITEWVRIAAIAAAHGLEVSGHCAQSLHSHVACSVDNVRHLEYFADHARVDRLLFEGVLEPTGGELRPDLSRPGHGLDVKLADAERYRVA